MLIAGSLLTTASCGSASRDDGVAAADAQLLAAGRQQDDWIVGGRTYDGDYWSPLTRIDAASISQLAPAWTFDFDTVRGQEAEPLVVDGVMYVTSAWSKVFALDAATGRELWRFDPEVAPEAGAYTCCDVVNRGVAYYDGKVYLGATDGRLIALDARTGAQVWSVVTADWRKSYTITGAPRIVRGKVVIGNGGADFRARGYVTAYDAQTGEQAWRFFIVPGQPGKKDGAASDEIMEKRARKTWSGDKYWRLGGGGTAWNAISYDPELNQLYVGTGNGAPWDHVQRSEGRGDNLFLASILALDPDTGKYIWHYQANPGETWDYNSTQPMILADINVAGKPRKALLQAHKNGFFYVIDRRDGKLISADPLVDGITWASGIDFATGRPVENPEARFLNQSQAVKPAAFGAHGWHPMAFDRTRSVVYLTVTNNALIYRRQTDPDVDGAVLHTGVNYVWPEPGDPPLPKQPDPPHELIAWDVAARKALWRIPASDAAGVLGTAGGLVFVGGGVGVGYLRAIDGATGREVWRQRIPNGVIAVPISYAINGEQYVAVAAGERAQSFTKTAYAPHVGRVYAFKIGGKATLPPDPEPAQPLNPSSTRWPAATVAEGGSLYAKYCYRCHLPPGVSANVIPDLRRSAILHDKAVWNSIVLDGALTLNGMIGWKKFITPDQSEAIRAYVDDQAQKAQHGQKAGPTPALQSPLQ
jgi:quinohemoprotein ethanol dehydrogenase